MGRRGPRPLPVAELKRRGSFKRREHGLREKNEMAKAKTDISIPPAPSHLSETMTCFWNVAMSYLGLEGHQVKLPQRVAEAWDRGQAARKVLEERGIVFEDGFGQPRPRPEVKIEHDARLSFAKLMRELGLDDASRCLRENPEDVLAEMMAARRDDPKCGA